jgi:hypothetical protein
VHVTTGQSGVTPVGGLTWFSEAAGAGSSSSEEDLGEQLPSGFTVT